MRIDVDYPDFLYLEEGRPSVFCANGSHGMWAMEGRHRRRIKAEKKAKVVAAVWETVMNQFLAALAILHQDDLKKGLNSSYSSYRPGANNYIIHIVLVQIILFFTVS